MINSKTMIVKVKAIVVFCFYIKIDFIGFVLMKYRKIRSYLHKGFVFCYNRQVYFSV